jgi:hypothetical protein
MRSIQINLVLVLLVLLVAGCGTKYETVYPTLSDGKYDSEFPYRNCSEQLGEIAASLSKLDVLVFYRTYSFSLDRKMSIEELRKSDKLGTLAEATDIYSESVGGTAMTIAYDNQAIAYLSCAHVVDYPDTVITYFPYPDNDCIQLVGIKARQQNSVSPAPPGGELKVLAIDKKNDIAILGKEVSGPVQQDVPVLSYPMGKSEELEWGSFVYLMGYPLGHAMITRGIVSDPGRIKKGTFLIDAVFNQGFSGGPVIAVRDGVPNFEIVGMVKSSAALNKIYLKPAGTDNIGEMNFNEPYEGELRIVSEKDVQYGITFSVTTKTLQDFYKDKRKELIEKGYFLDRFFGIISD